MNTPSSLFIPFKTVHGERLSHWRKWSLKPCADLIRPHDTFTLPNSIMQWCPAWIPKRNIVARWKLLAFLLPPISSYCQISACPHAAHLIAWGNSPECSDGGQEMPALHSPRRWWKDKLGKLVEVMNKIRIGCEHNLTLVRLTPP